MSSRGRGKQSQQQQPDQEAPVDNSLTANRGATTTTSRTSFPMKLYKILENTNETCGMFWSSDGKHVYFVPKTFNANESKTHFQGTPYNSFSRRMYRHGFDRILTTPTTTNTGGQEVKQDHPAGVHVFRHPNFQKGRIDLIPNITMDNKRLYCRAIRDNGTSARHTSSERVRDNTQAGAQLPPQQPLHSPAPVTPAAATILAAAASVAALPPSAALSLPVLPPPPQDGGDSSCTNNFWFLPGSGDMLASTLGGGLPVQPHTASPSMMSVSEALLQARLEGERRKLMLASLEQQHRNARLLAMLSRDHEEETRRQRELEVSREQDLQYLRSVTAHLAERERRSCKKTTKK